jgi:hypothetical protein
MPWRDVDAATILDPGTKQPIVTVNRHLMMFVYDLVKIASGTIHVKEIPEGVMVTGLDASAVRQDIAGNIDLQARFADALLAFNREELPEQFDMVGAALFMVELEMAMELFVVGHEYGHVLKDHHGADTGTATTRMPAAVQSWVNEFEADCIGVRLLSDVYDHGSKGLDKDMITPDRAQASKLGALLFLEAYDILLDAMALIANRPGDMMMIDESDQDAILVIAEELRAGQCELRSEKALSTVTALLGRKPASTHPPALVRERVVSGLLRNHIAPPTNKDQEGSIRIALAIHQNLRLLEEAVLPLLPALVNGLSEN